MIVNMNVPLTASACTSVPASTLRWVMTPSKVVIPFSDPVIVGRFVYHCHAVDYEDKGMMGIVEVIA